MLLTTFSIRNKQKADEVMYKRPSNAKQTRSFLICPAFCSFRNYRDNRLLTLKKNMKHEQVMLVKSY